MFGVEMLPHDDRYDMAEEWLGIVKRLWTEDDEFDHEGKFYKIVKGYLQPKPLQQPFPAVMNAGGSERGRHFAAKYCDLVFTALGQPDFEQNKAQVDAYRGWRARNTAARSRSGPRRISCRRETEAEARRFDEYVVQQKGDREAATFALKTLGLNAQDLFAGSDQTSHRTFHRRLGRLSADRHQRAGGRRPQDAVRHGARRRAAVVAALRGRHARVQGRNVPAAGADRVALSGLFAMRPSAVDQSAPARPVSRAAVRRSTSTRAKARSRPL